MDNKIDENRKWKEIKKKIVDHFRLSIENTLFEINAFQNSNIRVAWNVQFRSLSLSRTLALYKNSAALNLNDHKNTNK